MKKLLTIVVISALTLSTLVGCGKKNESTVVEPTTTVETTVEPTETVEPVSSNTAETTDTVEKRSTEDQEVEEVVEEVVDLPGYLIDYPLIVGDKKVYIKLPEGYETFDDKMDFWGSSYSDIYESGYVYLFPNDTSSFDMTSLPRYIVYGEDVPDTKFSIDWYKAHKDIGDPDFNVKSYEITEENFDNGIIIYSIIAVYDNITSPSYLIYYSQNDITIKIDFYGLDSQTILDFYKTVEDPFIIQ